MSSMVSRFAGPVHGGMPTLFGVLLIALSMVAIRACDVDRADEHAEPAFVREVSR